MNARMRRIAGPALVVALLLAAWEIAKRWGVLADALDLQDYLVAAPSQIAETLWDDSDLLADNAWVTLKEILLGLGFALVAGLAFAVVLHLSRTLRDAFYPLLVASQTIPVLVIAPILIVWFGFGIGAKIVIIALVCFFPITVNTLDGLRGVDIAAVKMMRTLGGSRWQIFRHIEAPTALPAAFSGFKIAAAVAVIGAVFAEWAGTATFAGEAGGLGRLMLQDNATLQTSRLFAAVVVLSAIAVGLFALITLAERRVVHWR
jgi:NitT/TauT family transport system permease protein/putative hydroxymethylpyrimidine transport system permease protein